MTMRELSERDILKICYLYYQEEKTQEEISKLFGVSRFKISRTLKEAKRKGYVTITINDPKGDFTDTEIKLANTFGLQQAIVVRVNEFSDKSAMCYDNWRHKGGKIFNPKGFYILAIRCNKMT